MMHTHCEYMIIVLLSLVLSNHLYFCFDLESYLATDAFKPTSDACLASQVNATTTFSYTFTPSNVSHWNPRFAHYEPLVFLVEMDHHQQQQSDSDDKTNDSINHDQSWKIRIGRGGQVYSLLGAFGEAIPPQATKNAAWMDAVLQMVSVSSEKNTPQHAYFIHQAGVYMTDPDYGVPPPFYSPTLAHKCFRHSCYIVSWGQQAVIPTPYTSHVLYYTRYTNCGNGIMEVTQMIHNHAMDEEDVLTYMNVPWTGVRQSTFQDILLSRLEKHNNETILQPQFPMQAWGIANNTRPNLQDTGGFTTFVQSVPIPSDVEPFRIPCVTKNEFYESPCSNNNISKSITLTVQANNTCRYVAGLSMHYESYIVRLQVYNYSELKRDIMGCRRMCGNHGLLFTNTRSGFQIHVTDMVLWVYRGKFVYFGTNETQQVVNREFLVTDSIQVTYANVTTNNDSDLSLTFIHGRNPEYSEHSSWFRAPSRVRFGGIQKVERDLNVFTVNFLGDINPGETFSNRFFQSVGRLADSMDAIAEYKLVDATRQEMVGESREIETQLLLVANDETFHVVHYGNDTSTDDWKFACMGATTPISITNMSRAFFSIQCGNLSYVGPDPNHFAVIQKDMNGTVLAIRTYLCRDLRFDVRPIIRLVGFFSKECNLGNHSQVSEQDIPRDDDSDEPNLGK